jgi:hypothetical protein
VGQEISCRVQFGGKSSFGKAMLESKEILFRGDSRLKIPLASFKEVKAVNGKLRVTTADGITVFELGDRAEKWRDKILKPKSVIEKLGVKPGDVVTLHGSFDQQFHEALKRHRAIIGTNPNAPWKFLHTQARSDLVKVKTIAKDLKGAAALWLVYPKGQNAVTESDVREAGLKEGLKDIKVVSFSHTHTALKFVLPKEKR